MWPFRRYLPDGDIEIGKGTIIGKGTSKLEIGNGVVIGRYCLISRKADVVIGADTLIEDCVQIITFNHNYEDKSRPIRAQGVRCAPIYIGAECKIGSGSILLPGAHIEDGTILPPRSLIR